MLIAPVATPRVASAPPAAAAPAAIVELGTLVVQTWDVARQQGWLESKPAHGSVIRSGITDTFTAVGELIAAHRNDPSAADGYVALVRHGATWDAVQLDVGTKDGVLVDFHPAPGVDVRTIWNVGGYPFPAWGEDDPRGGFPGWEPNTGVSA